MNGAGSKAKGAAFEREVCKKLSVWITNGKKGDCFWRSAMSGGRATVARKRGRDVRQAGDITAVAPEGHKLTDHVFIECKHYADLQFDSFVIDNKGTLAHFWGVVCREAEHRNRSPWLVARQNRRPTLLLTRLPPIESASPLCLVRPATLSVVDCQVWLFDQVLTFKPPRSFACQSCASISAPAEVRTRERI